MTDQFPHTSRAGYHGLTLGRELTTYLAVAPVGHGGQDPARGVIAAVDELAQVGEGDRVGCLHFNEGCGGSVTAVLSPDCSPRSIGS